MTINRKQTSDHVASLAAKTLNDPNASQIQRSLAASALAQSAGARQTGAEMEDAAARALANPNSADLTLTLAASVLAQANKER